MNTTMNNPIGELNLYVERAKGGDKDAFQFLVSRVTNTVNAIALGITKNLQDSKDVTQLVFIKMWQQLGQLKNNDSLLPWLRQITRYTAINFIRDGKVNLAQQEDEEAMEALLERVCDEQHQHDSLLIKQQQSDLISHLMDQLPDETREIVILYYREEHNSKAVAELLGLTEATVRKRLQRAREFLKETMLAKYGKVLFATSPIGLASLFATTAMTSSPVAASTLAYTATSAKHSSWLGKLVAGLGGAAIGGILALMANTLSMNFMLKHIDNESDIAKLTKIKHKSNAVIILTCLMFALSYSVSQGWVLPVVTYLGFLAGLVVYINAANKISFENLERQSATNEKAAKLLTMSKWGSKLGWVLGVGGGTFGLLYGLYASGRFAQLF